MLIRKKPEITKTVDGQYKITFSFDSDEFENFSRMLATSAVGDEPFDLKITRKKRRSVNANAYAWKLIAQISAATGFSPNEVYKQQIINMYCYEDVQIKTKQLKAEISSWESKGCGWIAEILWPPEDGTVWIRKYRGSSSFSSKEMAHFIDNLLQELDALEIPKEKEDINCL